MVEKTEIRNLVLTNPSCPLTILDPSWDPHRSLKQCLNLSVSLQSQKRKPNPRSPTESKKLALNLNSCLLNFKPNLFTTLGKSWGFIHGKTIPIPSSSPVLMLENPKPCLVKMRNLKPISTLIKSSYKDLNRS